MWSGHARTQVRHAVHLGSPSSSYFGRDGPAGALGQLELLVGYCTVIGPRSMLRIVMRMPLRMPVPHIIATSPASASLTTTPVSMTHASDAGMSTFQPSASIWSMRMRGSVPRIHMSTKMPRYVLIMKTTGASEPPSASTGTNGMQPAAEEQRHAQRRDDERCW